LLKVTNTLTTLQALSWPIQALWLSCTVVGSTSTLLTSTVYTGSGYLGYKNTLATKRFPDIYCNLMASISTVKASTMILTQTSMFHVSTWCVPLSPKSRPLSHLAISRNSDAPCLSYAISVQIPTHHALFRPCPCLLPAS
jgi:hypothetical protein